LARARRLARLALALLLAAVPAALAATPLGGTWHVLAPAPISPDPGAAAAWTGKEMVVFGTKTTRQEDGAVLASTQVAAAYSPATNQWRRLSPPLVRESLQGPFSLAWTGREVLVWGPFVAEAYDPARNRWRTLPPSPIGRVGGIVVWTGRQLIGWGGGCCGDAFFDGAAYDPAKNRWRKLPPSPLAGSQGPLGTWTGRELVIFVGGFSPDGKPWPKRLARAAAYDPVRNSWRRIAPLPSPRAGARAVWDGREVLVVGGSATPLAYNPATNRWRTLRRMDAARTGFAAVWTGKRLLLWGGTAGPATAPSIPAHGLAYDPKADRWTALPPAPILGRPNPTGVWTGRSLVVWGGGTAVPAFADGAAFTPSG
jgi:hypothetical protein